VVKAFAACLSGVGVLSLLGLVMHAKMLTLIVMTPYFVVLWPWNVLLGGGYGESPFNIRRRLPTWIANRQAAKRFQSMKSAGEIEEMAIRAEALLERSTVTRSVRLRNLQEASMLSLEAYKLLPSGHPYEIWCLLLAEQISSARIEIAPHRGDYAVRVGVLDLILKNHSREGEEKRGSFLLMSADAYLDRYKYMKDLDDLRRAVENSKAALDLVDQDDDFSVFVHTAVEAGRLHYEQSGELDDLLEVLRVMKPLIDIGRFSNDEDRADYMMSYCSLLIDGFERSGDVNLLDELVESCKAGVEGAPLGDVSAWKGELGLAYLNRYEVRGAEQDLTLAIKTFAQAAESDNGLTMIDHNLANAYLTRFDRYGQSDDLNAGLHHARAQMRGTLESAHETAVATGNLLGAELTYATYQAMLGHQQDYSQILSLISNCEEQVGRLSVAPEDKATVYGQMGTAILQYYAHVAEVDPLRGAHVLERAEAMLRESLSIVKASWRLSTRLHILSLILFVKHEASIGPDCLDEATALARAASKESGDGTPASSSACNHLAMCVRAQFARDGLDSQAQEVISLLRIGYDSTLSPPTDRLESARFLGEVSVELMGDYEAGLSAYSQALDLLPQVVVRSASRNDNERSLSRWSGIANDAAACALRLGRARDAIQLIEKGRGIIWNQLLELDLDLERLRQVDRMLAAEFDEIRSVVLASSRKSKTGLGAPDLSTDDVALRVSITNDWNRVIDKVRAVPGFSNFLRSPDISDLLSNITQYPLVVVNASRWGCHAILARSARSALTYLPLERLVYGELMRRAEEYFDVLQTSRHDLLPMEDQVLEDRLLRSLDYLWNAIVEPVYENLSTASRKRRIWWYPTGVLSSLPLHAAQPTDRSRVGALDLFVSSYVPSLGALGRLQRPTDYRAAPMRLLVVGMSQSEGEAPLVNVENELDQIAEVRSGELTVLRNAEATRDAVLAGMRDHPWLHFSCHGMQNPNDPASACLRIHDGDLTIADVEQIRCKAEVVLTLACQTAVVGLQSAEEMISIASAFSFLGSRQVVGTLWTVYDSIASELSVAMHRRLADVPATSPPVARILNDVICDVRERSPEDPSLWIHFVHIGV
jgi:tetratricopeptide (TPR) repeat protein